MKNDYRFGFLNLVLKDVLIPLILLVSSSFIQYNTIQYIYSATSKYKVAYSLQQHIYSSEGNKNYNLARLNDTQEF